MGVPNVRLSYLGGYMDRRRFLSAAAGFVASSASPDINRSVDQREQHPRHQRPIAPARFPTGVRIQALDRGAA
jgi:hypothetical protein